MSMEFNKNISDWSLDCTDRKNGIGFSMRFVKYPKIVVEKCQMFQKIEVIKKW